MGTHLVDPSKISRTGEFLRKSKLDELPQLINVAMGSMSLVGPRPCLENQLELIEEREKRGVLEVRPGITGLAQISQIDMSTPRKLARYDKKMVVSFSTCLYFWLILATLTGKGVGDKTRQH